MNPITPSQLPMTFEDAWLQDPANTLSEDNSRKRDAKHYYDAGVRAERERIATYLDGKAEYPSAALLRSDCSDFVRGYLVALADKIRKGDA